jgi:hypothetical protein
MTSGFMMSKSNKLNILVAFPYFSQAVYRFLSEKDPSTFRLIVDSGAFTAWNTGREIRLDDYMKFLKTIPSHWDYKAVQLDVFGNPEGTYENYHRMLDAGFEDIMPVFTRGDSLERLEEFYSHTDYIMFGGIVIGGENRNYVKWFCEVNKGRDAHWLGFVNVPFIKHYRPKSVDSSTLYNGQRFGTLQYYVGGALLKGINRKQLNKPPPAPVINSLTSCGFSMKEIALLAKQESWEGGANPLRGSSSRGLAAFMTVTSHVRRAIDVEKNLGTRIYLALCGDAQLQNVYDAMNLLTTRKEMR